MNTPKLAKLTSKNQLTLPRAVVAALGHPSHFRVQLHAGALVLWPGRVVTVLDEPEAAMMLEGRAGSAPK
ncbi:hypothetical protein CR162_01100 [Pseudoroseomonas rhizosphaerae]|uniref:AbrB family transcriptional regulator n=1 Tax=Teichococcus rhizosphaerae TaxID=1335062 RepID=A0A2C7AHL7_9PROT|nr:hypothetical protein [Pseudoroseomonas rhizosphaerae]PHK96995.1 hypothetical protein CR162_01100 [Pseudoroseomonas rhizosphaerae]